MPKQLIEDNVWKPRLDAADKYYKEWENLFKCKILENYYEGRQWKSQLQLNYNPYVINKVYETIQIKIAEFVPSFPKYMVSARPSNMEYDEEEAARSAQLKEDVLNTIIWDDRNHFSEEIEQSFKDSFFRFGLFETGYASDWILNPNVKKPLLKGQTDREISGKRRYKRIDEPTELPVNERVFFKHIPARRFRVGGIDNKYLARCSWVGYYDFVLKDDLLSLPKLLNRDKIESAKSGASPAQDSGVLDSGANFIDPAYRQDIFKVWHIWELRSKLHLLLLDDPVITIFQRKYQRLPLHDLRPDRRLIVDGFYPIPTAYHWLSPQDELNETREMLRAHRRRFIRKFQFVEGTIDDEEVQKFESQQDGGLIKVKRENAITPIADANLGTAVNDSNLLSSDDLNKISGTSSESRGVADRTTATQAKIVDNRSGIREDKERDRVIAWFCGIGSEILLIVKEKFALGMWTRLTSPEGESFLGEVKPNPETYKWVTSEDLNDGYDFKINIDVTSMSVTAEEEECQKYLKFLGILIQFPFIAFSPKLVRETAYRAGYRNEGVIQEMQKMALLMEQGRMMQLQMQNAQLQKAAGGGQQIVPPNGNAPQQIVAQQTPPDAEQMANQMQNQLVQ